MARIMRQDGAADGANGAGGSAVLSLADIAAEARRIILDARRDAARAVAEARAEADAARQAAERQGYADGLARAREDGCAEGRAAGMAQAKEALAAETAESAAMLKSLLAELQASRAKLLEQARAEMLQFALEVAAKIVGRVAAADPAAAEANLRKALAHVDGPGEVVAAVHPSQTARLEACLPHVLGEMEGAPSVRVVGDERVAPGGVKLAWGLGEIDATVDTQLANVAEALLGRPAQLGRYEPAAAAARQGASP